MSMSKQHYIAIANHFKSQRDKAVADLNNKRIDEKAYAATSNALFNLASGMSADFYNDNIRFDRQRFMTACGF